MTLLSRLGDPARCIPEITTLGVRDIHLTERILNSLMKPTGYNLTRGVNNHVC
jgi:hypothetical protein